MADFFDVDSITWQPVRPGIAFDIFGKSLLEGRIKAVLTRVAPGGRFAPHRDPYGHLFFVLEGAGRVMAGMEERSVGPGSIVRIAAGELHGYQNNEAVDLVLMSLNLPEGL